jgi:hypothetical protein
LASLAALLLTSALCLPAAAQETAKPSADMQAVLDKLAALDAKPFATLTVPEARTQASAADAAKAVQWDRRISSNPQTQVATKDIDIPTGRRHFANM